MPLKYLRLGFTETTLLFIYFIETYNKEFISAEMIESKKKLIKWLYTTSGYYDKKIQSCYMDAKHTDNSDPVIYKQYFNTLLNFIKDADVFSYGIHYDKTSYEFSVMLNYINKKKNIEINKNTFFDFTKNKSILIISPFSELFKEQYYSENCKKINPEFREIKNVLFYTNIYTFFNNGPHNNIIETCDYIYNDIINNITDDYNSIVISCGAYSNILANKFYNNNKNVLTIGGDLPFYFGILNKRCKKHINVNDINIKLWITEIPEKYKPNNYHLIEDGCYW
jgi:hypothetical protein